MGYEAIIPHMTNNNTPSPFVAFASNQLAAYAPYYAFQDNGSSWISDVANSHITIDLGQVYEVTKVFFSSVSDWTGARVHTFILSASNDLLVWHTLEKGSTTGYTFTGEKEYGAFRYWRIQCLSMTMRGACISKFQLYQDEFGATVTFNSKDSWVMEDNSVSVEGTVFPSKPVEMRYLINGVPFTEWKTITIREFINEDFHSDVFQEGANVITLEVKNSLGVIKTKEVIVYKISLLQQAFAGSSYMFKIKNSPRFAQTDAWVGQSYGMKYLNSEPGVSYMFKYQPFSKIDARITDTTTYADKDQRNRNVGELQHYLGIRSIDSRSSTVDDKFLADIKTIRTTMKSDGYLNAFKEAGITISLFDTLSSIIKEDIGIISTGELALKKNKIVINMLEQSKLPAYRKQEIKNAISLIEVMILDKELKDTVVDYKNLFEKVYPHKDTIIAMGYLNASTPINIAQIYNMPLLNDKIFTSNYVYPVDLLADKPVQTGIAGEYLSGLLEMPIEEAIITDQRVASKLTRNGSIDDWVTLVSGGENIGLHNDVLLINKNDNKRGIINDLLLINKDNRSRSVYLNELQGMHKDNTAKEGRHTEIQYVNSMDSEARITQLMTNVNIMEIEAWKMRNELYIGKLNKDVRIPTIETRYLEKQDKDANNLDVFIPYLEKQGKDANNLDIFIPYLEKQGKDANNLDVSIPYLDKQGKDVWNLDIAIQKLDKGGKDVWDLETAIIRVDKQSKDMWILNPFFPIGKDQSKEGAPIFQSVLVDNMAKEVYEILNEHYTEPMAEEAYDFAKDLNLTDKFSKHALSIEIEHFMEKMSKEVFKMELMRNIDAVQKASLVQQHWSYFSRTNRDAKAIEDAAVLFIKEERKVRNNEDVQALREMKDTFVLEQLVMDYTNLDAYIYEIGNGLERIDEFDTVEMNQILSDKTMSYGIVEKALLSYRQNQEKESYIEENFLLAGDNSEWQDIWERYSPGVDILDPPDDDYNYDNLKPLVYDESNGRPLKPIGATNMASVVVGMPISHPIPENNEVGIDETKRIAVDNYIFIDSVLALESIKNRNKLRYAGMPAGKTIQEVFSQLYTWIQQAAPGHEEYERMFRFSRWYAEAIVIKQSKFILEREYAPWRSSLHTGAGLGVPHSKAGWVYNSVAGTLDTTSLTAILEFQQELMIDGELILRGYFDNPLNQGTIEILVDGVSVDSFKAHGVFTRSFEVPQGLHTIRMLYTGLGGSVSLSTIEVTGVQFVSAKTITDDSDTNGLKALTELMAQLLGYFELHHGDGKVKGTMEIRQRAVWNTHT